MNYAGSGSRFLAALIDGILLGIVNFAIGFILGAQGQNTTNNSLVQMISLLLSITYYVYYQGRTGQTVGKKAMGIKVVSLNGAKPTFFTFFLREIIGKTISALILLIGFFMILWDKQKQGLHDKIASTYVVKA